MEHNNTDEHLTDNFQINKVKPFLSKKIIDKDYNYYLPIGTAEIVSFYTKSDEDDNRIFNSKKVMCGCFIS